MNSNMCCAAKGASTEHQPDIVAETTYMTRDGEKHRSREEAESQAVYLKLKPMVKSLLPDLDTVLVASVIASNRYQFIAAMQITE